MYEMENDGLPLSTVSCLTLTPSKIVVGTYEGLIHLFSWPNFKSSTSPILESQNSNTLLAHHKRVYSVACMTGGAVTAAGTTTFCPTFVGRCSSDVPRDFLISVGYGKYSVVADTRVTGSVFRSFHLHSGVCLYVWMVL